ncbi:TspO/MBR family protein [Subtercola boreus]|uniref:Tryptophan-rich sensory protein n=1 Tax=Subtercola boreus TaxID=120213 RepID=A0A3E0W9A4_9MICO|nr:TspO/MBR family protein [Subtercola boreus]RFA17925.1 hypothetical protein B7R24_14750 [Subtercola boreus]RFA18307.1 hypothetical protein B7R23_14785 [Subtercola boreus]RFA24837.1 hypothetical protein B7R25_14780 [Subtercola boreus]
MTATAHSGGRSRATPGRHSSDLLRQILVAVGAVVAVVGAFVGSGAAGGTPIAEAAGGALSADATLLAPAGGAFAIWSIIYLGLVAYAVWQLLPAQRTDARQRFIGYPVLLTLIMNAAWILSVQAGLLVLSAVIIVLLLIALCWAYGRIISSRARGRRSVIGTLLTDGTMGLYLGWVSIATAANLTSGLQFAGFTGFGWSAEAWGVAVVGVAGAVGVLVALWSRGSISPTLSLAWGLAWVAVSRLTGTLESTPVAVTAIAAAAVVVVVTVTARVAAVRAARSA